MEIKNTQVLDYLLILVFHAPVPWYPLLHLAELVFYPSVQVEQPGPQRTRFLGVLQVEGGRHDPQRLEQAGLDMSQRVYLGLRASTSQFPSLSDPTTHPHHHHDINEVLQLTSRIALSRFLF